MADMPNDALLQAQQDVAADPSTAIDSTDDAGAGDPPTPDPGAGDSPGDGSDGTGADGRTLANVRGEFERKLHKETAGLRTEIAELKELLRAQQTQPSPVTLDTATAAQLEALRPQVPADKLPEFDRVLNERRGAEQVRQMVAQEMNHRTIAERRAGYNTEAYNAWPELHDRSSQLYRETNRILGEMGGAVKENPRSVLDAANSAGIKLGLEPKNAVRSGTRKGQRTTPVGSRTAPASGAGEPEVDEAALSQIASGLKGALPSGAFSKEAMGRIKQNTALYNEHRDLYVKKV